MELFLPIPEGKEQRQENGSWQAYLWSSRGYVEMNNSISLFARKQEMELLSNALNYTMH